MPLAVLGAVAVVVGGRGYGVDLRESGWGRVALVGMAGGHLAESRAPNAIWDAWSRSCPRKNTTFTGAVRPGSRRRKLGDSGADRSASSITPLYPDNGLIVSPDEDTQQGRQFG